MVLRIGYRKALLDDVEILVKDKEEKKYGYGATYLIKERSAFTKSTDTDGSGMHSSRRNLTAMRMRYLLGNYRAADSDELWVEGKNRKNHVNNTV